MRLGVGTGLFPHPAPCLPTGRLSKGEACLIIGQGSLCGNGLIDFKQGIPASKKPEALNTGIID